jgi:hypothetical protein|nr:MAG TPA: hypothetical protein [Crassvirales sp.]
MKDFVKNLIEQHKFATSQFNRIETCIETDNALLGVSNGEVSLDEYAAIKYQNKVLKDYVSVLELRLEYNNVIVTEGGDYFEKVEDKSNKDA